VNDDKLGIGCLAHEGAIFLKLSQEGIEMERELFMGSYFSFLCLPFRDSSVVYFAAEAR